LASVTLGCWAFAFFVGVLQACGLHEALGDARHVEAASVDSHDHRDDVDPGCEGVFADDVPLLAKLTSVQDQPGGQAFVAPSRAGMPLPLAVLTASAILHRPRPPPGIAAYTLFVRLAL